MVEHLGHGRPAGRRACLWGRPDRHLLQPGQTFEVGEYPNTQTVHLPKSCLHCEDPPCVPVCPTGASYKRPEDGIGLVDADECIGCKYCAWACPCGVRELDEKRQVMTKCTLCVDRIHDPALPVAERWVFLAGGQHPQNLYHPGRVERPDHCRLLHSLQAAAADHPDDEHEHSERGAGAQHRR